MIKSLLLASVASVMPRAFSDIPFTETCEVVTVTGSDGKPLRINKSDYDADQADGGGKQFKLHADEAAQPMAGPLQTDALPAGITIPPAPAAPTFIDPAAPQTASPGQMLVQNIGSEKKPKFIVVQAGPDNTFPPVKGNPAIDEAGYPAETEAWAAIVKAQQNG